MLAGLRGAAKSKLAIPVIIVLAGSFAVWGVNDAFRGGPGDAVATVGPEKIGVNEYARLFRNQIQTLSQQNGRGITTEEARQAGLDRQLLNELVVGAALDAKAGEMALSASDIAIARDIQETEPFQDSVRGEFSRDVYLSALSQAGLTPSGYETSLRRDLAREQLLEAVDGAVPAPQALRQARSAFRNETRTTELLILPAALAEVEDTPEDAELQTLLDNNSQMFTDPERRAITVAWFDMAGMQAIVEVSDEDVEALFEFRRETLDTLATRSFVQLSAPDQETAEQAAGRLEAGEEPAAVAQALGLAAPIVEDAAERADIVDESVAEEVFDGGVEPRVVAVDGALGWAAIKVTGGVAASEARFEDHADQLRAELAEENAQDTLYDAVADFEDARGAGMSLEDSATAAGVVAESYAPLDASGRDQDGDFYVDVAQAPVILREAFAAAPGQTTELLDLPDGGYAIVRVDRIEDQRLATLDEARDRITALWTAQERDERLQEIEAEAREMIEGGASFAEAAEAVGPPARNEITILKRGETAGAVDQRLSGIIFQADQDELATGLASGGARALARVTKIDQPDAQDPAISASLTQELNNDLLTQFQNALTDEYPVRIYEDRISLALGDSQQ